MNLSKACLAEIRLLEQQGKSKPENIVSFASNPKTALHEHFTWDDQECGRLFRLQQARDLLHVYVTVVERKEGPMSVGVEVLNACSSAHAAPMSQPAQHVVDPFEDLQNPHIEGDWIVGDTPNYPVRVLKKTIRAILESQKA